MSPPETAGPLSATLRARTAAAHAEAERSPYLGALVAGRVSGTGLVALLSRLAPVYAALEAAGQRWAGDERVGRFLLPELRRTARLRADLEHLTGCADDAGTPAALAYAARVEQVAGTSAARFVAHHYTRCLADLSGGQVVRTALARSLGARDGSGASFFCFPGVRTGEVKQRYRAGLDAAPFSAAEREELVDEALVAYRLNAALTAELDVDLPRWTTP